MYTEDECRADNYVKMPQRIGAAATATFTASKLIFLSTYRILTVFYYINSNLYIQYTIYGYYVSMPNNNQM